MIATFLFSRSLKNLIKVNMNALYTSQRILISTDTCKKLISGGILVDQEEGRIKKIFTSQEEINSWLFIEHGGEVNFPREYFSEL